MNVKLKYYLKLIVLIINSYLILYITSLINVRELSVPYIIYRICFYIHRPGYLLYLTHLYILLIIYYILLMIILTYIQNIILKIIFSFTGLKK
jgi:hypothetical protein